MTGLIMRLPTMPPVAWTNMTGISPHHSGNSHPNDVNYHDKELAREEYDD